jgi:hypothetical protein
VSDLEILEICTTVRKFAQNDLGRNMLQRDRQAVFDREGWQLCAKMGIQGLPIPEEYGGQGLNFHNTLMILETLGEACQDNGLIFSLNAQIWSVEMPILHFGSEEQRRKYLPGLCSGSLIGVHGMTEPDSGSDALALRTHAVADGDDYILTGTKTFATNGPIGDFAIIFANLKPEMKALGITAFLVDRKMPGLIFGNPIEKMGIRTSPMGEIVLDQVRLPRSQRLGPEGGGLPLFQKSMEYERAFIFAAHLGAMRRIYARARNYAQERKQFGQPIGKFPPIADRLVSMRMNIELGELLLQKIANIKDHGGEAPMEAAMAKLFISEAYIQASIAAIQIFGGYGYTTEYEIEREHRDAIASCIYSGTSEIQKRILYHYLEI